SGEEVRHRSVASGPGPVSRDHLDLQHYRLPGPAARVPGPSARGEPAGPHPKRDAHRDRSDTDRGAGERTTGRRIGGASRDAQALPAGTRLDARPARLTGQAANPLQLPWDPPERPPVSG